MKLVTYPDQILGQRCEDIIFGEPIERLVGSMIETMYLHDGVGLAAPQLGVLSRLVVIDPSAGDSANELTIMINPAIRWVSEEIGTQDEGCLSLPGVRLSIARSLACDVDYVDMSGTPRSMKCVGWKARIVQHEIDHLAGVMMLDRVGTLARRFALRDMVIGDDRT